MNGGLFGRLDSFKSHFTIPCWETLRCKRPVFLYRSDIVQLYKCLSYAVIVKGPAQLQLLAKAVKLGFDGVYEKELSSRDAAAGTGEFELG